MDKLAAQFLEWLCAILLIGLVAACILAPTGPTVNGPCGGGGGSGKPVPVMPDTVTQ